MLRIFKQYYPIRNIFFILGEGVVIYLSIVVAYSLFLSMHYCEQDSSILYKAFFITVLFQTFLYYNDLYDLQVTSTFLELAIRLFQALGAAAVLFGIICFVFPDVMIGHWVFLLGLVFIIVLIVSWRFGYSSILNLGIFNQKVVLLGTGELAKNILKEINEKKDCGYEVSLLVEDNPPDQDFCRLKNDRMVCTGDYDNMCKIAHELKAKKVIVALKERRGGFPTKELLKCRIEGIEVLDGNTFYEMLTGKLIVEQTYPGWLIFSSGFHRSFLTRTFKRLLDIVVSVLLLIVTAPLMVLISICIKLESGGDVFFTQERVGQGRKPYKMYKFRSMWGEEEKPTWADEDRITRVGAVIRKLRFDEIPQAWNVLKGEMSFVGPRPEREYFVRKLEKIIPYYGERFVVKPGITGWAQVCYGYGASVEDAIEKLNYDLFYIKNMSFFMDLMIVLRTIKIVLFRKGAR